MTLKEGGPKESPHRVSFALWRAKHGRATRSTCCLDRIYNNVRQLHG